MPKVVMKNLFVIGLEFLCLFVSKAGFVTTNRDFQNSSASATSRTEVQNWNRSEYQNNTDRTDIGYSNSNNVDHINNLQFDTINSSETIDNMSVISKTSSEIMSKSRNIADIGNSFATAIDNNSSSSSWNPDKRGNRGTDSRIENYGRDGVNYNDILHVKNSNSSTNTSTSKSNNYGSSSISSSKNSSNDSNNDRINGSINNSRGGIFDLSISSSNNSNNNSNNRNSKIIHQRNYNYNNNYYYYNNITGVGIDYSRNKSLISKRHYDEMVEAENVRKNLGILAECSLNELPVSSLCVLCRAQCKVILDNGPVEGLKKTAECVQHLKSWSTNCTLPDEVGPCSCFRYGSTPADLESSLPPLPGEVSITHLRKVSILLQWSPFYISSFQFNPRGQQVTTASENFTTTLDSVDISNSTNAETPHDYPILDINSLFVIETNASTTSDWEFVAETNETSVEIPVGECDYVAFRVAAVNEFGSFGFTKPFVRAPPVPEPLQDLNSEMLTWNTTSQKLTFTSFFVAPSGWESAQATAVHERKYCTNGNTRPPQPDARFYKYTGAAVSLLDIRNLTILVNELGKGCEYYFDVHLSKCGVSGPSIPVVLNLTDCAVDGIMPNNCGIYPGIPVEPESTVTSPTTTEATTGTEIVGGDNSWQWAVAVAVVLLLLVCFTVALGYGIHQRRKKLKRYSNTSREHIATVCHYDVTRSMVKNSLYETNTERSSVSDDASFDQEYVDVWEIPSQSLQFQQILGRGAFGEVRKALLKISVLHPANRYVAVAQQKQLQQQQIGSHWSIPDETSKEVTIDVQQDQDQTQRDVNTNEYRDHERNTNACITVAVKMLYDQCESYKLDFLREIQLMKSMSYHPHVVSMIACSSASDPVCLVVEHMPHGDLLTYLRDRRTAKNEDRANASNYDNTEDAAATAKEGPVSSARCCCGPLLYSDLLQIALQIATGMEFLAAKGFVHRDLATRNVLVDHGNAVKIGDFGLTRYIYDDSIYVANHGGRLPLKWMAIEAISDLAFTTASDVWSYGVVLYELTTYGAVPYPTVDNRDMLDHLRAGNRMARPAQCTAELYALMLDCWSDGARPSFSDIIILIDIMHHQLQQTAQTV